MIRKSRALILTLFIITSFVGLIIWSIFTEPTIKLGSYYHLRYFEPSQMYELIKNDKPNQIISITVIDYDKDGDFILLHEVKSDICDKQSIYVVFFEQSIYHVIDDNDGTMHTFNNINDYQQFLTNHNITQNKVFELNDEYRQKSKRTINQAKQDGCI